MVGRARVIACSLAIGLLVAAAPAHAAQLDIGLGASYWFEDSGVFDLNLGVRAPIARHLLIGGRFGALLATNPNHVGIPLDLQLRVRVSRVYFEALGGPWILFDGDPTVRGHAGFGFGLLAGFINVGLEVGWLQPQALVSLRIAFPL